MELVDLKEVVEDIINKSFERLDYVYRNHQEKNKSSFTLSEHEKMASRLVFPCYSNNNDTRISEQELRFAFVETFNEYCNANKVNLFYSIETPTQDKYCFSGNNNRSGQFDLVIYNEKLERVCLIEFKAGDNKEEKGYSKDFKKLNNAKEGSENKVLRYFVNILKSYNNRTKPNLEERLKNNNNIKAEFRCYVLDKDGHGEDISNVFKLT